MMIAYGKHQCTIHFLSISEIDCINNFICYYVRNHFKHIITCSNCTKLLKTFYSIKIAYNKHQSTIHFIAFQKLISVIIVFNIS